MSRFAAIASAYAFLRRLMLRHDAYAALLKPLDFTAF